MKYQIIHEDDKHFKIHNPKDGSHFVVAKRGLSQEFIKKAQKLCGGGPVKMSDGGEVPSSLSTDAPSADLSVPQNFIPAGAVGQPTQDPSPMDALNNPPSGFWGDVSKIGNPNTPDAPGMGAPSQPAQEMGIDPGKLVDPSASIVATPKGQTADSLAGIADREKGALNTMAQAKQTELSQTAKISGDLAAQNQAAMKQLQDAHASIEAENAPLRAAIMNQKIDPNRLWNSSSTGNKIAASIGLILGGIGAGLTHGPNAALDVMQKAIDRDVDSQKADLGKKQTLYSMNMDRYKNADQAYAATMLNYGNVAKALIDQTAARSGSQSAMSQAQLMGAQIDERLAPIQQKLAIDKVSMQNADPVGRQVRTFVPEDKQKDVFHEVEQAQNAVKSKADLLKTFGEADDQNTLYGRAQHLGASPASVANFKVLMMPLLKDKEGRINESELERTDALIPSPGDGPEKIKQKRQGLIDFIDSKSSAPTASAYGIKLQGSIGAKKFKEGPPKF